MNQFYVQPGGDLTEGLAGIGDVLRDTAIQRQEQQKLEQAENEKRARQAAVQQALTPKDDGSFDLDLINKTSVEYPEMADIMFSGMNAKNDEAKGRTRDRYRELATVNATGSPEQVLERWDQQIKEGQLAGHNMEDSIRERDFYAQNPDQGKKLLPVFYAGAEDNPNAFKAWQEATTAPVFEAPETRVVKSDAGDVTQEFDKATGQWKEIGKVTAKQDQFQSNIGQLIADRDTIAKQYGQDSAQVKAIDEAISSGSKGDQGPKLTNIAGIRKEFTGLSSPFIVMRDAYNKINSAPEDAAGDLSLIFSFMKILDPGSVVREQEFANAQNAAGVPDQIRNAWNKALTGERLAPTQRTQFKSTAESLFSAQLQSQLAQEKVFRQLAERQEMDPNEVVVDFIGDLRPRTPEVEADEEALINKYAPAGG